jgi:alkaline phosphatase
MSSKSGVAVIVAATVLIVITLLASFAPAAEQFSSKIDANDLSFYPVPVTTAAYPLTNARTVRNVIVCIGDGMGLSQIAVASLKVSGPAGGLCIERMPVTGLVRTYSANARVTDSAAAGTALAAGIKTNNGMIGVAPDGKRYQTILEAAKARGMATGLVVTSSITDATPATFASHVKSRATEAVIAEQLIANRVNVLFGGGRKYFLPKSDPNSARKDDRDLLAEARQGGYAYVTSSPELRSIRGPYVLGLFQYGGLTTASPEPSLATLTHRAIHVLNRMKADSSDHRPGFFLMVEGSQIDWACHSNLLKHAIRQTLLFDQAVQVAVDFALRDGHTLVIVTADHETGGLTLPEPPKTSDTTKATDATKAGEAAKASDTAKASETAGTSETTKASEPAKAGAEPTVRWSTKGHTSSPVMIGALGPGAALFAGVQDNTSIPKTIAQLLGITPFPRPLE